MKRLIIQGGIRQEINVLSWRTATCDCTYKDGWRGLLLSVQEVVELSLLGAIEECIEFLYRIGDGRAGPLGVSYHDRAVVPRHLDATSSRTLDGGPGRDVWQCGLEIGHYELPFG